jgi:inner membrane transporter RhtA
VSTSRLLPPLAVLGSVTSLQLGAAVASTLFVRIGPAGASALRLCVAALILLPLVRPKIRRWAAREWRAVLIYGVVLAGMNGAFYEAVARIPLGAAVTFEFLGPLTLATVLSRRRRDLLWVGLALAGVVTLGWHGFGGPLDAVGVGWALVAALFWALYILAGSQMASTDAGLGGLAVGSAVAGVLSVPGGVLTAGALLVKPSVLLPALAMAVLASVVPYSLELFALGRMPKKTFSILLALEPAVAALAGAALLGQELSWLTGAAIVVVICAGVGATLTAEPGTPEPGIPPASEGETGTTTAQRDVETRGNAEGKRAPRASAVQA